MYSPTGTGHHATSLARVGRPQLTDYQVIALHGTASAVQSLTGA